MTAAIIVVAVTLLACLIVVDRLLDEGIDIQGCDGEADEASS